MAFMRMMGRDSVAYHQATVLGRADDHAGQSLDYYGTRGETPLVWGGTGAGRLGLDGRLTEYTYAAIFGEGGATDPVTGDRLVNTTRPGMELVVSPHKSVAVLGAIGRADDMHAIVDAETTATLEFLDGWFQERGGRRGRDQVRTATSGLTWAATRHGTSRAGDPAVHDHVLVVNIVEMRDTKGGWKALDTASLRDVLHAATVVGRAAAAHRAVELGYGIVADDGRSGRLRGWRIAGIPDEVCDLFSKRSAEIDDFVNDRDSYRARAVAARTTRSAKEEMAPDLLAIRWQTELAEIGWSPERIRKSIHVASVHTEVPGEVPGWIPGQVPAREFDAGTYQLAAEVLGPESRLGGNKVLSRRDLLVEVGPHLYGQPAEMLEAVVDRILESPAVVPLVAVTAAREQVYAPTHTLAVEHAVAETVERLTAKETSAVDPASVERALSAQEADLGRPLSAGQRAAVAALTAGEESRVHFIVGVAGAGKTTALDAATTALEAEGWNVLGTSTSGQAARTLGEEAAIEARTVASLLWRLDHGHARLDRNTIVVLDEAAMTTDDDLLRLVTAIDTTGARLVLVGDPAQLGAVGPGGAMAALMNRHADLVTHMPENLRQHDPAERAAVAHLRTGRIREALDWYAANDRIDHRPTVDESFDATVRAWDDDAEAGRITTMLAWRRDHVAELNERARTAAIAAGRVHGPSVDLRDIEVAVGDQLVTLEPNRRLGLVTSERLTVLAVDPDRRTVAAAAGARTIHLTEDDAGPDRLAYGYATTIHRAQGATVDTCHLYADGGTHQLAYVAVTRARERTTIHCAAESRAQAIEDLRSSWTRPDTQRWIIDDRPDPRHRNKHPKQIEAHVERARLEAERRALLGLPRPSSDGHERLHTETERNVLRRSQVELRSGTGEWSDTAAGRAARRLIAATESHARATQRASSRAFPRAERRLARQQATQLEESIARARESWNRHGRSIDAQLTEQIGAREHHLDSLPTHTDQLELDGLITRRIDDLSERLDPGRTPQRDIPRPELGLSL